MEPPQALPPSAAASVGRARRGPFSIVHNLASGSQDAAAAQAAIAAVLDAAGCDHRFVPLPDARRIGEVAAACARQAATEGGVVVAAGSDGTINAVAHAVLGSGCTFGVLPMGTFNYFGRTHRIPEDIEGAARVLVEGEVRPVQVGVVNDRVFLVNASLGLYPQLLEDREAAKRAFGRSRLVALGSALKSLARNHRVLRLRLRTEEASGLLDTPTLFVGNNRLQLEQIGMAKAACVEQGRLAAIALRPVSQLGMLRLALRGSLGILGDDANVVSFSARELTVSVASGKALRIKVATDGEVGWMRLPLRFGVAAQPLALLCPPPAAEG